MKSSLWHIQDIVDATNGRLSGNTEGNITGVSIDTRLLKQGDLFVALAGERSDGHDYVAAAFEAGAVAAVVQYDFQPPRGLECALVKVADTLRALNELGRVARKRSSAAIVAVTGSVGKTGTKQALADALAKTGETHSSERSYNNHFGVPLSLSRMPLSARFGVFEVGMNHPGEIEPLSRLINPDVSIITTVEPVHAEFFDTIDDIARAKAEIFCGMDEGGRAVLNGDNKYFPLLDKLAGEAGLETFTFGTSIDAHVRLIGYELGPNHSDVQIQLTSNSSTPRTFLYRIGAPGYHLVMNSMAVLLTVDLVGGDLEKAMATLGTLSPARGRGKHIKIAIRGGGSITVVDESYNANPASMRAALATVGQIPKYGDQRHIAVLGDMLELGTRSKDYHRELKSIVLDAGFDVVFTCGSNMWELYKDLDSELQGAYGENSADLIPELLNQLKPGDVVVVKGSLGSEMGKVVEALISWPKKLQVEENR